jgi:hypothetical protein
VHIISLQENRDGLRRHDSWFLRKFIFENHISAISVLGNALDTFNRKDCKRITPPHARTGTTPQICSLRFSLMMTLFKAFYHPGLIPVQTKNTRGTKKIQGKAVKQNEKIGFLRVTSW